MWKHQMKSESEEWEFFGSYSDTPIEEQKNHHFRVHLIVETIGQNFRDEGERRWRTDSETVNTILRIIVKYRLH
jgi:hypothetical protein